ncbi:MAG: FliH/SctL family protein [bacterium]
MSDVIKLNVKSKGLKVFMPDSMNGGSEFNSLYDEQDILQRELQNQFNQGFEKGYAEARAKLAKEFSDDLIGKSEEFYRILASFEEKLTHYETDFDKIIIKVSEKIAAVILKGEIQNKSVIESTLKSAVDKVIGANDVTIKINPEDYLLVTAEGKNNSFEQHFSKIKFEKDNRIERGGCVIETEIGSVDARISSQLNEIIKNLENNLLSQES